MKLSDGEKLIAIMLADIMDANKIRGEVDPDFIKEAITSGHLWALKWEYHGIFHGEDEDEPVVKETAEILDMCRVVEGSINQLSPEELEAIPEHDRKVFVGFDGNHDRHYGVARMFIQHLGRWEEFKDRGLNSHGPSLERYRAMLPVYEGVRKQSDIPFPLKDIQTVLAA